MSPAVAHPCGSVGHRIEHLLDRRANPVRGYALWATGAGTAFPGQREEVGPLGLVELERVGERVEDALGGAGEAAALHAHVVVDRDAGEHRDFLAPEPLHPAVAAVCRQARLLGGDPGAPRAQELADLGAQVDAGHGSTVSSRTSQREALSVPVTTGSPTAGASDVDWVPCELPTCTARATSA